MWKCRTFLLLWFHVCAHGHDGARVQRHGYAHASVSHPYHPALCRSLHACDHVYARARARAAA